MTIPGKNFLFLFFTLIWLISYMDKALTKADLSGDVSKRFSRLEEYPRSPRTPFHILSGLHNCRSVLPLDLFSLYRSSPNIECIYEMVVLYFFFLSRNGQLWAIVKIFLLEKKYKLESQMNNFKVDTFEILNAILIKDVE